MAGSIENFFFAWGAPDDRRDAIVREAVAEDVLYRDQRGTVEGAQALCDYVAQYTASAPGAAAEVAEQSGEGDRRDIRVRFFGEGWEKFGRYEVNLDEQGHIRRMSGVAEKDA